jgi:hypothetical protein
MVTAGPITGSGFSGSITYDGAFDFMVREDGVVEGTWNMLGFSFFSGGGDGCTVNVNGALVFEGVMEGTSTVPKLSQTGGYGNSTVNLCDGTERSGPLAVGAGFSAPITLYFVSCEQALGRFEIPANMAVASSGVASSSLLAPFNATRNDALLSGDMEWYSSEVTVLSVEGMDLSNAVAGGGAVDYGALSLLLERSEELYRQLRRINDCNRRTAGEFINSIRTTIAGLLDTLLENPDAFSSYDIAMLAGVAIRTGLIGAGAADPALAEQYELALINELGRRLDEGPTDCDTAAGIALAADLLGAEGILEAIRVDLDALCI